MKFPLKLLFWLVGGKKKRLQKFKLEQKQLAHVHNFDPTRLKNKSWQIRSGKKTTKKRKKYYRKKQKEQKIYKTSLK